jgi:hypothetical protein
MMKRQGDLLIVRVNEIPPQAIQQKSHVLAEGESTGHVHQLDQEADVYEEKRVLYFRVNEKSKSVLTHPEHKPLTFEPGEYRVVRQREYEPHGWRYVHD